MGQADTALENQNQRSAITGNERNITLEFVDVSKMQTSSASGMFLPGIYSLKNI
jgi:hypothetical protein